MTHQYSISGMTCSGGQSNIENALASLQDVEKVAINLSQSQVMITMRKHLSLQTLQQALSKYPSYKLSESPVPHSYVRLVNTFWSDFNIWKRSMLNTLSCLIGCSIGDFGMILFLQKYFPNTSMTAQMILATIAGLITSVLLESTLLKYRERFSWSFAFRTAFAMSFMSMAAMELAMNATDFMITGGKAAFGNPLYWFALIVSLVVGFLVPLPYNYYKLKKHNKACH